MRKPYHILLLFLAIPFVLAEDHYVTQSGAGSREGSSLGNAWSVSQFNTASNWDNTVDSDNGRIGPGDTVYFSGTITDQVTVRGSGSPGHEIILDGYAAGRCSPQPKKPCPGATIDRRYSQSPSNTLYGMYIENKDHLEIRDFNLVDSSHGLVIRGNDEGDKTSDHILVRNNYFFGIRNIGLITNAPYVKWTTTYLTVGGAPDAGNVFYNCAEGNSGSSGACITLSYAKDTVISYNDFYNDYSPLVVNGCDGIVTIPSVDRILIEYNTFYGMGEDALDFKGFSTDGIIRFNKVERVLQAAWQIQHESDNVYVYGNLCDGNMLESDQDKTNWYGLMVYRGATNVFFWSNIVYDWYSPGFNSNRDSDDSLNKHAENVNLWGNVIAFNNKANRLRAGVEFLDPLSSFAANNIIFKNSQGLQFKKQIVIGSSALEGADIDNNMYFFSDSEDFGGSIGLVSTNVVSMSDSLEPFFRLTGQEQHGVVADPLFTDEHGRVFTLRASSPAIDRAPVVRASDLRGWDPPTIQGVDYSLEVTPDIALHPDTDWGLTPPKVIAVSQDDYGSGWEFGAYVYDDGRSGCSEDWYCGAWGAWSACIGGSQARSRTCVDRNSCGTLIGKPDEEMSQSCEGTRMAYSAPKTNIGIVLDGEPMEFASAEAITLQNSRGTKGTYRFMWSESHIFFSAQILDSEIYSVSTGDDAPSLWDDDSLEMIFDTLNDGGDISSDDYKFFVNSLGAKADSKRHDPVWDSGFEAFVRIVPGGYAIEGRIPLSGWAEISDGDTWGFNIALNDRSDGEDIVWSGTAINIPAGAGEIIFAPGCSTISDVYHAILEWKNNRLDMSSLVASIGRWRSCG